MIPFWRKKQQEKKAFVLKNGGILLEKFITTFDGNRNPIRNFSSEELKLATNNYDTMTVIERASKILVCSKTEDEDLQYISGTEDEDSEAQFHDFVMIINEDNRFIEAVYPIIVGDGLCHEIEQQLKVFWELAVKCHSDSGQVNDAVSEKGVLGESEDGTEKNEAQIPSELITSCVSTMQICTERQYPPSDVAQIIDSAVSSLHPCCHQNLPIYREIEMCQIMSCCLRMGKNWEKKYDNKEAFIMKNGADLLEQLIASSNGKYNPILGFSTEELKIATNNYDERYLIKDDFYFQKRIHEFMANDRLGHENTPKRWFWEYLKKYNENYRYIEIVDPRTAGNGQCLKTEQQLQTFAKLMFKCISESADN
ncbi:hypothetical protein QYF36_003780 [Acer negundo]|nr:hypothetical protein QYF36_003780 [Acer negundo]